MGGCSVGRDELESVRRKENTRMEKEGKRAPVEWEWVIKAEFENSGDGWMN
jgi:hypothetical protein